MMDSTQNIQHNRKFKDFSWWYCIVYSVYLPVVTAAEVLGLSVGGEGEESHGLVRGHVPGLEQEAPEGILLTPAHQLHTYTHTRTHTRARHLHNKNTWHSSATGIQMPYFL